MTRSSPASDPEWATAAAWACWLRPTLTARIGLPMRERAIREGEEPLGPLEPLDEEDDRVRRRVVEAVGEVVAQVEHDLASRS